MAISAAVTVAVNWVALAYCVVSAVDPQYAVEEETNPVPVKVSVKAAPPAMLYAGDMLLKAGTGLGGLLTTSVTDAVAVL